MLFRVRSFLDEEAAELYIDNTELYPALSLAQLELVKNVADIWAQKKGKLPLAIEPLKTTQSGTITIGGFTAPISEQIVRVISLRWQFDGVITATSPYAIELADELAARRMLANRLLTDGTYFWYIYNEITVHPISTGSAGYSTNFIKVPVDITTSVQPETHDVAHDAIVERALWILLKDRESEQANIHLQMYGTLLKGLIS